MIFKRITPDKYYYLWRVCPCGQVIIAMAADDITNLNFGFKQFVTAVGIYAATNPLWPGTTFQCAVILLSRFLTRSIPKVQIFFVFVIINGSKHVQTYGKSHDQDFTVTQTVLGGLTIHCVHEKTAPLDNVR